MKLNYSFLLIIFILFSSCSILENKKECDENKEFKKKFFNSINNVENFIDGKGNRIEFNNSLKFISYYTKVSYENMLNYNNSYTNKGQFIEDKENWTKWYNDNKCNDLQIK